MKKTARDPLVDLSRSMGAFGRTIDQLQSDYTALEERHRALNDELAQINVKLQAASDANQRLAVYLDHVLAQVPAGIIAVDTTGVVRLYNPTAAALLGVPASDALNRPYAEVWPDRAADPASAAACAAGHPPVAQVRREFPHAGGLPTVVTVSTVRLAPEMEDAVDQHAGALEVLADLSTFETLQNQIAHMRTLAALGEMAATVAHQIRNPLGGMLGFAELLQRRLDGQSEPREMADKIVAGARQLSETIQRLLDFARDLRLEPRSVDWPQFLQAALNQYEENARHRGKQLRLVRRWPERLPPGKIDPLCLRQALWNILENAEQACEDGPIECSAAALADGGVCLRVADRGHGIDPQLLERVFAPFVTTREKGTGLGLATARKVIEAHGGRIALCNRDGGGVEVSVELPPDCREGR
jgi:signal transduction histidine kinase